MFLLMHKIDEITKKKLSILYKKTAASMVLDTSLTKLTKSKWLQKTMARTSKFQFVFSFNDM